MPKAWYSGQGRLIGLIKKIKEVLAPFVMPDHVYPCPCGYAGDSVKEYTCSSSTITRYQKRISGPLLDRIDIHIEVPRVEYEKLSYDRLGEPYLPKAPVLVLLHQLNASQSGAPLLAVCRLFSGLDCSPSRPHPG